MFVDFGVGLPVHRRSPIQAQTLGSNPWELNQRPRDHKSSVVVVVIVMTSPTGTTCMLGGRFPKLMTNFTRWSLSWKTSCISMVSPQYCAILPPTLGIKEVNFQPSPSTVGTVVQEGLV